MDEMIQKSTAIVRGRVTPAGSLQRGPAIYTRWRLQVSERLKGDPAAGVEVVTPGGVVNGLRQEFSGAPSLKANVEYVLFLWTGKSGLTHIIGLTQGVFDLREEAGRTVISRSASSEPMIDPATGQQVQDQPVRMGWSELQAQVQRILKAVKQ